MMPYKLDKSATLKQAMTFVEQVLYDTFGLEGKLVSIPETRQLSLTVERGFGISASVLIYFQPADHNHYDPYISLNWPSYEKNLAAANASLALYRQIVDIASFIMFRLEQTKIVRDT